jgi:hypothetical protein
MLFKSQNLSFRWRSGIENQAAETRQRELKNLQLLRRGRFLAMRTYVKRSVRKGDCQLVALSDCTMFQHLRRQRHTDSIFSFADFNL